MNLSLDCVAPASRRPAPRRPASLLVALALPAALLGQAPELLKDVNSTPDPTTHSSEPHEFAQLGDELYFSAFTPTEGYELRAFDLTSRSVRTVRDLIVGEAGGLPLGMTAALGAVYFSAYVGSPTAGPRVAFRTDGTSAGTVVAFDLPGDLGGSPNHFCEINGRLVFTANVAANGNRELFVSDGTS